MFFRLLMANFQVSQRLLELTRQSKRRIIEPEYYYDVIERYSQLFCPENTENNRLAYTEFWLKIDNAKKLYNAMRGSELNAIALCMQTIRTILKDKRLKDDRVIYPIDTVLMVIVLANLHGFNTADEIALFYKAKYLELVFLIDGIPGPEHMLAPSSINRIRRMFSKDEINHLLNSYLRPHPKTLELLIENEEQRLRPEHANRHTIGFDGQEITKSFVRGETSRRKKAAVGVTVFDCTSKTAIALKAVVKKNNEACAFLSMLPYLNIQNGIVCADALNTKGDISYELYKRDIDYLFNIKENAGNKELKGHIEAIFWREHAKGDKSAVKTRTYCQKAHGRIDQWTVNILPATLLDKRIKNPHQGVKTLVEYIKESTYIIDGKVARVTKNSRCYISSLDFTDENADQILYSIMDYWAIEQHHSRIDDPKVFNQDATQTCQHDYAESVLGINKVTYNILTWIRQKMIKESTKKSFRPSYSMIQDMLNQRPLFYSFSLLAEYYQEVNLSSTEA